MATLKTGRLLLRTWRESDLEPFARMNADPRVMEFLGDPLAPEASNQWAGKIGVHFKEHGFGLFAAQLRATGEFIGYIGLVRQTFEAAFTPCIEIGWRLVAEHWGRGLATEGARAVARYAFEVAHLDEIVSLTTAANLRSRRVMEKLGMVRDPAEDFDHPKVPEGSPLRRHVLYRLPRAGWENKPRQDR